MFSLKQKEKCSCSTAGEALDGGADEKAFNFRQFLNKSFSIVFQLSHFRRLSFDFDRSDDSLIGAIRRYENRKLS
jgi:hypothetical protein